MRPSTGQVLQPNRNPHAWDLSPGPRKYTYAPELTSSRLPTIHLSKSFVQALRRLTLQGSSPVDSFSQTRSGIASAAFPVRLREAESYRRFRRCQSAVGKILVQPSHVANQPRSDPFRGRKEPRRHSRAALLNPDPQSTSA